MEFWSKLPEIFKKDVVKKLDYKSRCCLRKVSKSDRSLVDSCPVYLDYVSLEPRVGNLIYFSLEECNTGTLFNDKAYCAEAVIHDFLLIFKNPKSKIKQLTVDHYNFQRQPDAINDLLANLISEIVVKYFEGFKLKIQTLSFHYGEMNEISFLNFMKIVDPKMLTSLHVRRFPIKTRPILDELVATDQWKSLRDIRIHEKIPNSYELFLHCDTFRVTFHNLSSLNIWKCIQNYRTNLRPVCSFFEIYTMQDSSIQDVLSHFDVPAENRPVETYMPNVSRHTQHFKPDWSNEMILVVQIQARFVRGAICRKAFLLADFEEQIDL